MTSSFVRRLTGGISTVLAYEEKNAQSIVRDHIDFELVFQYLCEEQERQALENKRRSLEELSIVALMRWFKCDFFKWCNKPACDNLSCDGRPGNMTSEGVAPPTTVEEREGGASRVEIYRCQLCQRVTRFPRYNNPAYMVKHSRRGRCGEFANVFGMVLRSLGFDVRYVLDFTDHVWLEVWIQALQRFVHCDPCERALDSPLAYEAGWKKKLTHVLSFSRYGVDDAISRYTRALDEVILRRNEDYQEAFAQNDIAIKDAEMESRFVAMNIGSSNNATVFYTQEFPGSLMERFQYGKGSFENLPEISIELMATRRRMNKTDLESMMFLKPGALSPMELQGRISGDLAWRQQRGEVKPEDIAAETAGANEVCGPDENALCTTGHNRSESLIIQNLWTKAKDSGRFNWFSRVSGFILSRLPLPEILLQLPLETSLNNYRLQQPTTACSTTVAIHNISFPVRKEGVQIFFIDNQDQALYSEDGTLEGNILERVLTDHDASFSSSATKAAIQCGHGGLLIAHIDSRYSLHLFPMLLDQLQRVFGITPEFLEQIVEDKKIYLLATVRNTSIVRESVQVLSRSMTSVMSRKGAGNAAVSVSMEACKANVWIRKSAIPSTALPPLPPDSFLADNTLRNASFVTLDNTLCSRAKDVIFAEESDTEESLRDKAIARLISSTDSSSNDIGQQCIGFSIVRDSTSKQLHSALLFAPEEGIGTMRSSKGAVTYLLSAKEYQLFRTSFRSSEHELFGCFDTAEIIMASFHDVGGGVHGDTQSFDGTDLIRSSQWNLSQIDLWAGDVLAYGVQCLYQQENEVRNALLTPKFSSADGNPSKHSFVLTANDTDSASSLSGQKRISKMIVQAGALIDGITLTAEGGETLTVGGSGGERIEVLMEYI